MTWWDKLTSKRWAAAEASRCEQTVGSSVFDMSRQWGHGLPRLFFVVVLLLTVHPGPLPEPNPPSGFSLNDNGLLLVLNVPRLIQLSPKGTLRLWCSLHITCSNARTKTHQHWPRGDAKNGGRREARKRRCSHIHLCTVGAERWFHPLKLMQTYPASSLQSQTQKINSAVI